MRERPPAQTDARWPRWQSLREVGLSALGIALLPLFLVPVAALVAIIVFYSPHYTCSGCGGPGILSPATDPAFTPASAATRLRDALHLLTGVILPPGSVAVTTPPELRSKPAGLFGAPPATDVGGRVWRVPLAASQARVFFNDHPPGGISPEGSNPTAEGSGDTALTGLYYGYYDSPGPSGLTSLDVVVVLDPVGPAATVVRVDAQADS